MNASKPTAPRSTVVGTPVPPPNEEELNLEPPREYAKNELPEWIKPNPEPDAATKVSFEVMDIMFFLFCLNLLLGVLVWLF
tara:strand:- start:274 stop:516 length:243 start_codon:yes stop_codon:yes gene_type:complete